MPSIIATGLVSSSSTIMLLLCQSPLPIQQHRKLQFASSPGSKKSIACPSSSSLKSGVCLHCQSALPIQRHRQLRLAPSSGSKKSMVWVSSSSLKSTISLHCRHCPLPNEQHRQMQFGPSSGSNSMTWVSSSSLKSTISSHCQSPLPIQQHRQLQLGPSLGSKKSMVGVCSSSLKSTISYQKPKQRRRGLKFRRCRRAVGAVRMMAETANRRQEIGVIISGAPASGKGTQCELIVERLGFTHISTGELLRAEVKSGSECGKKAKQFIDSGLLVPNEMVAEMVENKLRENSDGWLLDGYPRTLEQAETLKSIHAIPNLFILLEVPDDILVERVVGRRQDPVTGRIYHLKYSPPETEEIASRLTHRVDDTEEKARIRLATYHANVNSVIEVYRGIARRVDGNRPKEIVFAEIATLLGELQDSEGYGSRNQQQDEVGNGNLSLSRAVKKEAEKQEVGLPAATLSEESVKKGAVSSEGLPAVTKEEERQEVGLPGALSEESVKKVAVSSEGLPAALAEAVKKKAWIGVPTKLNTTPHSRQIREYFYGDVCKAAKKAVEDGISKVRVQITIPELNPEMDVYRIGTLLEIIREIAFTFANDGKRVRVCVQGSMGQGIYSGMPLQLAGTRQMLDRMDWGEHGAKGTFINIGSVGAKEVTPEDDMFILMAPQNAVGNCIIENLEAMVAAAGDRPVIIVNPRLKDLPAAGGVMQVQGREKRMQFVGSFFTCYNFRLLYQSGTQYPILGALRMAYPSPYQIYKRIDMPHSKSKEAYVLLPDCFEKEPSGSEIGDAYYGRSRTNKAPEGIWAFLGRIFG